MAKFQITGLLLMIVATIFYLIGFASPYWLYSGQGWQKAVQAFACLGLICLFVSTLCSALKTFYLKDKTPLLFGSLGSAFAGAFCVFLAVVIFGAKREDLFGSTLDLPFAFAFCIIGMIAAIAAGVMI